MKRKFTFRLLPSVASLLFAFDAASAPVTLLQSDFTGTAPAQNLPWTATSVLDPSILFNGWTKSSAIAAEAINNVLGFSLNMGQSDFTLTQALAADGYLSASLQPSSTPLNLNGVKVALSVQRISYWSAPQYAIFTSVSGFGEGQQVFITPGVSLSDYADHTHSFFLPATGYDGVTGSFEIRVVPFNGRYAGHDTSITGFSLTSGIVTRTLTLSAESGGTAMAIPDATTFEDGEVIQLTATPDADQHFAGWTGDVTGLGNPRTVTMDANKTVMANFAPNPPPGMSMGTNLGGVVDWSPSWVFKDLFKRIRPWLTRNADQSGSWDSGLSFAIPVDAQGWPTQVPFDPGGGNPTQLVHTILVSSNEAGPHTLFYQGEGTFRIRVGAQAWQSPPTDGTVQTLPLMVAEADTIALEITASGPFPNHLRNFRIVPDAFLADVDSQPFHPQFLDRSSGFDVLRFMDWGRTNGQGLTSWADRTRPDHQTQSRSQGVSLEYMVALCNHHHSDAWVCIPHQADDNYVTQAATLLRYTLDPELKIYVEYSNETWNSIFSQTTYVQDQGQALALDLDRWQSGHKFVARRSSEIWKIFETVFGSQSATRVVKVLATQSANISVTNSRVAALNDSSVNPDFVFADALAIAPYFGHNYTTAELPPAVAAYPSVDDVVNVVSPAEIAAEAPRVAAQKAVADLQGMSLICYEGGQHFTGLNAAQNDTTLTNILTTANRDPRMYRRYEEYLDMLKAGGVEVFANFTLCGGFGKYGSWGSMEFINQSVDEAFKYSAIRDWIAENNRGEILFRVTRLSPVTGDLELDWRSKPARTYRIDTSTTLQSWTPGPSRIPSQGLSTSHTLSGMAGSAPIFVKVVEE